MKIVRISIIYLSILLISIASYGQSDSNDTSHTIQEYYKHGVPKNFQELRDYGKAYNSLSALVKEDKSILPKYDSEKSGSLFNKMFNKSIIDKNFVLDIPSIEKRQLLSKYSMMLSDFSGIYLMSNPNEMYTDESALISSIRIYSEIRVYELMDTELSENNAELPNDKVLFLTKMVGRSLWGLEHKITRSSKIDDVVLKMLKQDYNLYRKKISSLKFLNYDENIKKIDSLY